MKTETSTPTAPVEGATAGPRRLYRSRDNKMVRGVAGGVAEYFGIDPVLVRLAIVVSFAMGGFGFVAYLLASVIVPQRPKNMAAQQSTTPSSMGREIPGLYMLRNRSLGVWILIGFAVSYFFGDIFNINFGGDRLWPLLLIGGGVVVLMRRRDDHASRTGSASAPAGTSSATSFATGRPSWDGAPSTTLFRDTRPSNASSFGSEPTKRDLQAEALDELYDPVVDEVERAVAELRAERAAETRMKPTPLVPPVAVRPKRSRARIVGVVMSSLLLFLLGSVTVLGIRVLGRGVGTRTIAPTASFKETFGAGKLIVDLDKLDENAKTGDIKLDFGQVAVQLPEGADRPTVELTTKTRFVSVITDGSDETSTQSGGSTTTRTYKGCSARTVRVNVSVLGGNITAIEGNKVACARKAPATAPGSRGLK